MANIQFRSKLALTTAVVTAMLCGCAFDPPEDLMQHNFTEKLSQPRPRSADKSYAMAKMHSDFASYTPRVLGCLIDTAVWEDELPTHKGGFDPLEVYEATIGFNYPGSAQKAEELSKVLKKYGTMPWVLRWGVENTGDDSSILMFLNNNMVFADMKYLTSLENKSASGWSTEGVLFSSAIFLVGALSDSFAAIAERNTVKQFNWILLSYKQTPEDEIALEKLGLSEVRNNKEAGELGDFYAARILNALAKAAEKAGYTIASDVVDFNQDKTTAKMHIALEGKGCPKANPEKPWKGCSVNVAHARYKNDAPFSIRLGLEGSKSATIIYDAAWEPRVILPGHTQEEINESGGRIVEYIVKDNPNMTFYWPPVKRDTGWEPQYVLDSKGKHYFVVPVKRGTTYGGEAL